MAIPTNTQPTFSFDKSYQQDLAVARPESYKQLFRFLDAPEQKFIARGAGLSYAPASFVEGGISISTELFNRVLAFDKSSGLITCEPGIRLHDLLAVVNKSAWTLAILPGYPSISVGGCVAFNIHGKSQFHTGNFVDCIMSMKLYHPAHGEMQLSRDEHEDLFLLTAGGMGLTGFITEVTLQLVPLDYKSIKLTKRKVASVYDGISFLQSEAENYKSVYSWHNFMRSGQHFGQGVVYCEQASDVDLPAKPFKKFRTAQTKPFPINMLSYFTTGIMNRVYEIKDGIGGKELDVDLASGSFPIYGKEIYYALFGKRGFLEYQFICSADKVHAIIKEIEQWIKAHKQPVSLASLKLFKGENYLLNFCGTGVCLALDVPRSEMAMKFFYFLDELCVSTQSIMNISKDSRVTKETIARVYPEYTKFKEQLTAHDPQKLFHSEIRSRLEL